jgi:hypothetical protein
MKKLIQFLFLLIPYVGFSQALYQIRIGTDEYNLNTAIPVTFVAEVKTFEIKKTPADNPAKTYSVKSSAETKTFATDGQYKTVTFAADVRDEDLSVLDENGSMVASFKLKKRGGRNEEDPLKSTTPSVVMPAEKTAREYIVNNLFSRKLTSVKGVGIKIDGSQNTAFNGTDYIHLFFDQNGNSVYNSIPVGIERGNYVVHIVYLVPKTNPMNISYNVEQAPAEIEEGILIRGDGSLQTGLVLQARQNTPKIELEWRHYEQALTPSSKDVKFDIIRNGFTITDGNVEASAPVVVATKEIKMKRIYHGSVDVGVLKTGLEDPTYSLVPSIADPNVMVVKKADTGPRVVASAMYTFYVSPVVLIEKIFAPEKVRSYRLEGRSFVDDHRIYERIYPTAGIGLNKRVLDNVFVGAKWEFVRSGSLFIGYHWAKVNVLDVDDSFQFGSTPMQQSTFTLLSDREYRRGVAIGLNVDIRIITNLFQTSPNN